MSIQSQSPDQSSRNQGRGLWQDERRSPGYLPQGKRAPLALLVLVVIWLLFHFFSIPKPVLGSFVIFIGLSGLWVATLMNETRLSEERYARGPGWWIGWLISKTSVGFARGFYIVLGLAICALGVITLLTGHHGSH